MAQSIVIATVKSWNIAQAEALQQKLQGKVDVHIITEKSALSTEFLEQVQPDYVFFPHWSWIIPKSIHEAYECVVFHMTDLPFGRGGSPLQNLISRGITSTKVSAIKVVDELDAGDIYHKVPLQLHGNASDIFSRASNTIIEMMQHIIEHKPTPIPQEGEVVCFPRRKPHESKIPEDADVQKAYDWIRMLDAEGYPPAFIEQDGLRLEFSNAKLDGNSLTADVRISGGEQQ